MRAAYAKRDRARHATSLRLAKFEVRGSPTKSGLRRRWADQARSPGSRPVSGRNPDTLSASRTHDRAVPRYQMSVGRQASCCVGGNASLSTPIPSVPCGHVLEAKTIPTDRSSALGAVMPQPCCAVARAAAARSCVASQAGVAMSDATNMSKPVTRGELRMELEKLPTKAKLIAVRAELKKLATKDELKKLATKAELKKLATKDELK